MVNPFPDFLRRQIERLAEQDEEYDEVKDREGLFGLDDEDVDLASHVERPSDIVIGMNTDERWQSITNSCWEIQQVKPLHGGAVVLNGLYRFKHVATERYLSLDIEGRVNLVLRARSPSQHVDTLFILRPLNQEQELADDDGGTEGHEIYHGTKFYLETAYSTFL